jgi:hypothetical protein
MFHMRAFYSGHFVLPLPPGHRFPMGRYVLLREQLERQLPEVEMLEEPRASDGELALGPRAAMDLRHQRGHC